VSQRWHLLGNISCEDFRGALRQHTRRVDGIFDRERHAVQWAERFAVLDGLVCQVRTLERIFRQQGYDRVDLWIDGLDSIEMCLDDFT